MSLIRRVIPLLVVATVLASACSDDDSGTADDAADAGETTSSSGDSDEGSSEGAPGSGVESELPIPMAPGGGEVLLSTETDLIVNFPADDFDRLVQYYDDWTAADGETYDRTESENGAIEWTNDPSDPLQIRAVIIAPDAGGFASVTLLAGPG